MPKDPPLPPAAGGRADSDTTVSVVVVTWNAKDLTLRCLDSLLPVPVSTEVVVVDNASTDGTREALTSRDVRVVPMATNTGFAGGANAGIAASRGDIVVLVNNDAVVDSGFLDAITAPFGRAGGDDLGATTGRVLLSGSFAPDDRNAADALVAVDGTRWVRADRGVQLVNSTGNEVTRSGNGRDRDWLEPAEQVRASGEVFGFNGGCAALSRRALEDVGGFADELFLYYEDTELSWRMRRRGWRIEHVPTAITVHDHAASSGTASPLFANQNERNRLLVALIHAPLAVVVRATARTLVRVVKGPQRRRRARALAGAARLTPWALRRRRRVDRTATVSRATVATFAVPDGARR